MNHLIQGKRDGQIYTSILPCVVRFINEPSDPGEKRWPDIFLYLSLRLVGFMNEPSDSGEKRWSNIYKGFVLCLVLVYQTVCLSRVGLFHCTGLLVDQNFLSWLKVGQRFFVKGLKILCHFSCIYHRTVASFYYHSFSIKFSCYNSFKAVLHHKVL